MSGNHADGVDAIDGVDGPVLYATDLDQTLIFSSRAAGIGSVVDLADVVAVEHVDGRAISFVTPDLFWWLARVRARCVFVPVTTRTIAQYHRITLFNAPNEPEWAVAANGGHLLHRGVPDLDWNRAVHDTIQTSCDEIDGVVEWLANEAGEWMDHVRVADDLFAFGLVDRDRFPATVEASMRARLATRGWTLSVQGRKLYAVPSVLTKAAAITEVRARTGASQVIAAGDSLLDLDLLAVADVAMRPAHGELHAIDAEADIVTTASGIAAAVELLRTLDERLP